MKVRDHLAKLTDEHLDMDAGGIVLIMATKEAPLVYSTIDPVTARTLLSLIAEHGNWSDTRRLDN